MLSFNKGEDICVIRGGKYNKRKLKIFVKNEEKGNGLIDNSDSDSFDEYDEYDENVRGNIEDYIDMEDLKKLMGKGKNMSKAFNKLVKAYYNQKKLDGDLGEYYDNVKKKCDKDMGKELNIHDGRTYHYPRDNPERMFVVGPSGSGKSTYISNYLKFFKKKFPDRKIVLFSDEKKDKVLDMYKPLRIALDSDLIENPVTVDDLEGTLCIFDDIDSIVDKKLSKTILGIRDNFLTMGRKHNISVIVTNHVLTAGNETKKCFNESTSITIYPRSGASMDYMLKRYCGMDKHKIKKLMALPSRWVTIFKGFPMFVLYNSGVYLL